MRLVVLGDFHYARMQNVTEEILLVQDALYNAMLQTFLEIEADYHISLGDFTNQGFPEEFQYLYDKINNCKVKRNFVQVLGNHDTISIPKKEILALTKQKRYHSIETREAILVFLDTTQELKLRDYGGVMDGEQADWLEQLVLHSGDKTLLVFAHHPVYATTAKSEIHMHSIYPDQDIWPILRKKTGYGYYFCGHNHVNSIVRRDDWHFIQTAACLDIPAYRMIDVEDGKVNIHIDFMEDEQLNRWAKRIGTNMVYFNPSSVAAGDESDHTLAIDHTARHLSAKE